MKVALIAAVLIAIAAPAGAQVPDSPDYVPVLSAAVGAIRSDFTFGRIVVDRAVIDTTKRLTPPLLSHREHHDTESIAKANLAEAVNPEAAQPTCMSSSADCAPNDVTAAIGLSDPVIRGDSARVWVRFVNYDGSAVAHLRTTVEILTLRRVNEVWRVTLRRLKAVG